MIRHFFAEPTEESDSEEQTTSKDVDNPEVWAFLKEQYEYLAQLHEVFVSNTNYASSRLPYYETSRYLVPGIEPPEPPV